MERRSTHRTTPRRKYTVDPFEGLEELEDATSASEVGDESQSSDEDAEDFQAGAEESSEDEEMSGEDAGVGADEIVSDAASDAGERLVDENEPLAEDDEPETPITKTKRVRAPRVKAAETDASDRTYTRGIQEGRMGTTNTLLRKELCFGTASDDIQPAVSARQRWADEPSLPSRAQRGGRGGMHESYFAHAESLKRRAEDEGREWRRYGGVQEGFKRQCLRKISADQAKEYMPDAETSEISFLMGQHQSQKMYSLPVGGSVNLMEAWMDDPSMISESAKARPGSYKNGFMLNLGGRVQCLEWVPHQRGQYQYLAGSMLSRHVSSDTSDGATRPSAFIPQPPSKSCITIWALKGNGDHSINLDAGCHLHTRLCVDYGEVKEMKFCPMPMAEAAGDLTMLASLWSDGAVRVLQLPAFQYTSSTNNSFIKTVAFESKPPDTMCTCITWISTTQIAAGCANGSVAIWNLPTSTNSTSPNPRPKIYASISTSYIFSMTSCYPSRPDFLLSTSTSGYTSLTDLSSPGQSLSSPSSTVFASRKRIAQRNMAWHDHLQLAIHTEDNYRVIASPLRRFFVNITVGRAESNATALATSPCHPFVLMGSAKGEVFSVNPIKKILDSKPTTWQQSWFAHEWRRPRVEKSPLLAEAQAPLDGQDAAGADRPHGATSSGQEEKAGLSRIVEGFKIERNHAMKDDRVGYNAHNGVAYTTVYEEESAVTAVAWNPNLAFGGWAAAGMGDGLVRVENIAS